MSKLEELINELCPNGVEYKKIKEVTEMKRGSSLTKKNAVEGVYPVISGGRLPAFYCDKFNREGETITVAGSGIGAGYVQYWNEPIFANDCFTLKGNNQVIIKFVYYSLKSIQKQIYETKKGGGVPHCHISSIENLEIPVPLLPIQEEIVRVLDNFTELTAELTEELTAELTSRRKQYEYYRDELFNFGSEIELYKLVELCDITRGKRVVKSQLIENGDYPVFQNTLLPMGYFNQYNCDESSSYVVSAGSAGEVGFCLSKSWMADDCLFVSAINRPSP